MSKNATLGMAIIVIISVTILACGTGGTSAPNTPKPTSRRISTTAPRPTPTPRPTSTKTPVHSEQPTHEIYAGFTSDKNVPFLILHESGERLGVIEDKNSLTTGGVWISPSGKSIVFYMDARGLPKSAVVGDDVFLYSNYTNSTVDMIVMHANGKREMFRSGLDTDLFNKLTDSSTFSHSLVASSNPNPPQQLDWWAAFKELSYGVGILSCVGAASALTLEIPAFGVLAAACASPLLEEVIREKRIENLDVGHLELMQGVVDISGCLGKEIQSCIDTAVSTIDTAAGAAQPVMETANEMLEMLNIQPTKKTPYP